MMESLRLDEWEYSVTPQGVVLTGYDGDAGRVEVPGRIGGRRVDALGERLFAKHGELSEILLPEGLRLIGDNVFFGCTGLVALRIPDGVESIGECAFASCASLFSLSLPEGLLTLGGGALDSCDAMPLVYLPERLCAFFADPFAGYRGRLSLKEDHPGLQMRDGVLISRDGKTLIHYPSTRQDMDYAVPEGVERILPWAFTSARVTAVHLPDSMKMLPSMAFLHCTCLSTLRVPEGCAVAEDAIAGCPRLEKRARRKSDD